MKESYKAKVQAIYPEAVCEVYNGFLSEHRNHYVVFQNFKDSLAFDINRRYEMAAFAKTSHRAWKEAWELTQRNMLWKLEHD